MYSDTHAHLNDEQFREDVDQVIKKAQKEGMGLIIIPGLNLETSKRAVEIAERHAGVYAMVGVHPEEVIKDSNYKVTVDELVSLVESSKKVVGIGEIGMDFYWDKERKTAREQRDLFLLQAQVAHAMRLPVMIHSREAEKEIRDGLESLDFELDGQFHCFGESEQFLEYVLKKGFYVSFCGNVTYKKAEEIRELAKKVPGKKLLIETDAPYLAPEGKRGERNEPVNVKMTAGFLAELRGEEIERLAATTLQNAVKLYGIR